MPTPPISTLFLLLLLFFFAAPVLSQSDQFQYFGFSINGTNLTAAGAAAISLNGVSEIDGSGILRLTNETSRLIGRAFYPSALHFKNATTGAAFSFSTAFAFAIVPEYPKLGGHGLAFAIAPTPAPKGLPSQYLGLLNASDVGNSSNHAFFVEFDTVQDFEFQDINDNHVGVNINDMRSNGSAAAAYYDDSGTKQDLNLKSGRTIQGWVDYDGVGKILNVTLSPFSTKPSTPLLSVPLDLSPILLNDPMFVGFSSSTGLLASSHYLFGWSFRMNGEAPSLDLSALPSLPQPKKKNAALIFGTSVSAFLLLIAAAAVAGYLVYKIRNADVVEAWELQYGPHRFSYKELRKATKGFRDRELLGFGGFGKVYKGVLPRTKEAVAVKRVSHESRQGLREFVAEIASIGRLRHRNLVQLQGWCRRRADLILVYDYMPNGSLDKLLFDPDPAKLILSWTERYKIIRGVASALLYLHEEWEHVVIHRDVKASNVLLDADMNGRLGDFGLAKLYEHGTNPSTTRVVGTLGYLAPELTRTGKATTSTDVFAFGALVLEVICGRRPIEPKALPEELILVDWVWDKWRNEKVAEVVDPRLNGEFRTEEAEVAVKVGLMCSHPASAMRPSMRDVVRYLDGDVPSPDIVMPPEESERRAQVGFEDYVHSYPSSSFGKLSNTSTTVVVNVMDGSENTGDVALSGRGRFFGPYSPVALLSS